MFNSFQKHWLLILSGCVLYCMVRESKWIICLLSPLYFMDLIAMSLFSQHLHEINLQLSCFFLLDLSSSFVLLQLSKGRCKMDVGVGPKEVWWNFGRWDGARKDNTNHCISHWHSLLPAKKQTHHVRSIIFQSILCACANTCTVFYMLVTYLFKVR